MTGQNFYFSGQGRLLLATRDAAGAPQGFRDVGNVSALQIGITVSTYQHKESVTGSRHIDLQLVTEVGATMQATFESIDAKNLSLILWGSDTAVVGSTVTAESQTVVTTTDIIALENLQVSSVVVTNTGAVTTYVEGVDYTVNAASGSIQILESGTIAPGVILVSYTFANYEDVQGLVQTSMPERWARFEGLNTANSSKPVVVDIFRAGVQPLSQLDLLSDQVASMQAHMQMLRDEFRVSGSQYFRVRAINQ